MPGERATVFNKTNLGIETVSGTPVTANKALLCTQMVMRPIVPITPFRPMGYKYATTAVKSKEHSEADIEGVISYNDLLYLFSGLLSTPVTTTPAGATLTRRHTFSPSSIAPDNHKTFTVEMGSSAGAERFSYGLINALGLRVTPEESSITGSLIGQAMSELVTLNPSPTVIPELPIDPDDVNIYLGGSLTADEVQTLGLGAASAGNILITVTTPDGISATTAPIAYNAAFGAVQTALEALSNVGVGDIVVSGTSPNYTFTFALNLANVDVEPLAVVGDGTFNGTITVTTTVPGGLTKLNRCSEFTMDWAGRFTPQYTLDNSKASYSAHVERAPDLTATLALHHDAVSAAFMQDMRDRDTLFCRFLAVGAEIEAGFRNRIEATFPCKITESVRGDNNDVWSGTYTLTPIHDPTFGAALSLVIDNQLTSL